MEGFDLDAFVRGFGLAALWADLDADDPHVLWAEVPAAAKERLAAALGQWAESHIKDLYAYMEQTGRDPETVGHDTYLTAEGHGTGLWDTGAGAVGERLTRAAQQLEYLVTPYRDEDGTAHLFDD